MTGARWFAGFLLAACLGAPTAPVLAGPAPPPVMPEARPQEWFTSLSLGPQYWGGGFGAESSLLHLTLDGHLTGGGGLVAGGDERGGYLELEGLLVFTPHDEAAARMGHEYPGLFLTAGVGPAVRWSDGAAGLQATVSAALAVFPILFVRAQRFAGDSRTEVSAGVMIKVPFWFRSAGRSR